VYFFGSVDSGYRVKSLVVPQIKSAGCWYSLSLSYLVVAHAIVAYDNRDSCISNITMGARSSPYHMKSAVFLAHGVIVPSGKFLTSLNTVLCGKILCKTLQTRW
jgi:hypothetical protein